MPAAQNLSALKLYNIDVKRHRESNQKSTVHKKTIRNMTKIPTKIADITVKDNSLTKKYTRLLQK